MRLVCMIVISFFNIIEAGVIVTTDKQFEHKCNRHSGFTNVNHELSKINSKESVQRSFSESALPELHYNEETTSLLPEDNNILEHYSSRSTWIHLPCYLHGMLSKNSQLLAEGILTYLKKNNYTVDLASELEYFYIPKNTAKCLVSHFPWQELEPFIKGIAKNEFKKMRKGKCEFPNMFLFLDCFFSKTVAEQIYVNSKLIFLGMDHMPKVVSPSIGDWIGSWVTNTKNLIFKTQNNENLQTTNYDLLNKNAGSEESRETIKEMDTTNSNESDEDTITSLYVLPWYLRWGLSNRIKLSLEIILTGLQVLEQRLKSMIVLGLEKFSNMMNKFGITIDFMQSLIEEPFWQSMPWFTGWLVPTPLRLFIELFMTITIKIGLTAENIEQIIESHLGCTTFKWFNLPWYFRIIFPNIVIFPYELIQTLNNYYNSPAVAVIDEVSSNGWLNLSNWVGGEITTETAVYSDILIGAKWIQGIFNSLTHKNPTKRCIKVNIAKSTLVHTQHRGTTINRVEAFRKQWSEVTTPLPQTNVTYTVTTEDAPNEHTLQSHKIEQALTETTFQSPATKTVKSTPYLAGTTQPTSATQLTQTEKASKPTTQMALMPPTDSFSGIYGTLNKIIESISGIMWQLTNMGELIEPVAALIGSGGGVMSIISDWITTGDCDDLAAVETGIDVIEQESNWYDNWYNLPSFVRPLFPSWLALGIETGLTILNQFSIIGPPPKDPFSYIPWLPTNNMPQWYNLPYYNNLILPFYIRLPFETFLTVTDYIGFPVSSETLSAILSFSFLGITTLIGFVYLQTNLLNCSPGRECNPFKIIHNILGTTFHLPALFIPILTKTIFQAMLFFARPDRIAALQDAQMFEE